MTPPAPESKPPEGSQPGAGQPPEECSENEYPQGLKGECGPEVEPEPEPPKCPKPRPDEEKKKFPCEEGPEKEGPECASYMWEGQKICTKTNEFTVKNVQVSNLIGPDTEKTVSVEITAPPGAEITIEFLAEGGSFSEEIWWFPQEPRKFLDTYHIPEVFVEGASDKVWVHVCNLVDNECIESEHVYAFFAE